MNPPLPGQLIDAMANRTMRMYHFLYHEVRHNWLFYPKDVQETLRGLGWEPPRPAWDENGIPVTDNDSGEDYLYMHRQMIARANAILAQVGDPEQPRIEGWVTFPPPDDPDYPVPPYWYIPEAMPFVNQFNYRAKLPFNFQRRFVYWERLCTDPAFLRRVTLGQLGSIIEETLYDGVRARWAAPAGAWRPDPEPGKFDAIPSGFDAPQYDFLRDTYSMHVNPIYWKFFGWVDDRVEDWKLANGIFGNAFWKNTWEGRVPELDEQPPEPPPSTTESTPPVAEDSPPPVAEEPTTPAPDPPASEAQHPHYHPHDMEEAVKAISSVPPVQPVSRVIY